MLCALFAASACREAEHKELVSSLALHYLPGCAPERIDRIQLEPLGHFALQEGSLLSLPAAPDTLSRFDALPGAAQWFRLSITTERYRGVALSPAGEGGSLSSALMLPLSRPCTVVGTSFELDAEAAVTLLPGGDLLVVGGLGAGVQASSQAQRVRVAEAQVTAPSEGLFVPRARAAAAQSSDESWVLGGALSLAEGSPAFDTFERYSAREQRFVGLARLASPRMEASALSLPNGGVLLVGGRASVLGAALDSVELALPEAPAQPFSARLPFSAIQPALALRDDGRVLVIGDVEGAAQLALIDLQTRGIEPLSPPTSRVDPALAIALPGARNALVEVNDDGTTTGRLVLLLSDFSYLTLDDWLTSFAGMERARAVGLRDGRIVLAGVVRGQSVARVLDLARREVSTRMLEGPVEQLLLRNDGSVLLVGGRGVYVLREDALTPFDNPAGTLLADDSPVLNLEAYGRFTREGLALRSSLPFARLDFAALRFRDMEIELSVNGPAELLLRRDDGAERTVAVGSERIGPAFCQLTGERGAPILISRREQRITLRVGTAQRSCVLDGMSGELAVGLRALEEGVRIEDLRITRR